ncbi:hypothetical protein GGQ57_000195 [Parabacteroides faecis]|uniref:Transposase n=1 Tax=Parabacteroides faecis TaxID=1217282 RepID=A0ABR6KFV7_9BACT|nr:hypothetical protein [Parabacteroides faecis]
MILNRDTNKNLEKGLSCMLKTAHDIFVFKKHY